VFDACFFLLFFQDEFKKKDDVKTKLEREEAVRRLAMEVSAAVACL